MDARALATGAAVVAAAFTALATVNRKGLVLFSLHPILMGVSVAAITVASLQFARKFTSGKDALAARGTHALLNYIGAACLLAGLGAIVGNKLVYGKALWPHSLHAWAGVAASILAGAQAYGGAQKAGHAPEASHTLSRTHFRTGLWVLAALTLASALGFDSLFNKPDPLENEFVTFVAGTVCVLAGLGGAFWVASPSYRRALECVDAT